MLYFHVGSQRCGIPLSATDFVIGMVEIRGGVPDGNGATGAIGAHKSGTLDFHGAIIPVYSLREVLGLPAKAPRPTDNLIIARGSSGQVALWVDGIEVMNERTLVSDRTVPVADGDHDISGAALSADGVLIITDLARFLAGTGRNASRLLSPGPESPDPGPCGFLGEDRQDDLTRTILADRAKLLATPRTEEPDQEQIELLRFRLMYREFAIEMKYIREAVLTGEITPVPGTPAYIAGICAIRGEILSLVDLRILFELPETGLTDLNRVIVLTNDTLTFGILADAITGIGTVPRDRIVRGSAGLPPQDSRYLLGVTDEQVTVLDAAAILADPRMVVDQSGDESQIPW